MLDRSTIVLLLVPIAYITGSVPIGLLVGLSKGVDPRTAGSGNIGATNVGRVLGGEYFAMVFTLDLLKGMLPMVTAAGCFIVFGRDDGREASVQHRAPASGDGKSVCAQAEGG